MTVDVVNSENKKVGSVELSDDVFGGRVKTDLIHESVVRANAAERRGTHATKNRGDGQRQRQEAVAPEGHRPRARRRNPQPAVAQGRHRVRAAAAQLRVHRAEEGRARRAAGGAGAEAQDGALIIVDALAATEVKTQGGGGDAARRIGVTGKALLVDVQPDEKLALSVRNIPGVKFLAEHRGSPPATSIDTRTWC